MEAPDQSNVPVNRSQLALMGNNDYLLHPVMNLDVAKRRLLEFQSFVKEYLQEGEDFGVIPGTPKPTLLKPGADKLCELYGLADDYVIDSRVDDFEQGLFDYTIKCILTSKRGGFLVATGYGSCNSFEKRYRWRDAQRKCPACGKEAITKSKEEYGGGWFCFAKKGGCGTKFEASNPLIMDQQVGKTANDDVADQKNTILKMAKKRAKVDATLSATRSSGVFTQDVEEMQGMPPVQDVPPPPAEQKTAKKAVERTRQQEVIDTAEQIRNARGQASKSDDFKDFSVPSEITPEIEAEYEKWRDAFADAQTVEQFNHYILPLMTERTNNARTEEQKKSARAFVLAAAKIAKERGWKPNRTTGLYEIPQVNAKTGSPSNARALRDEEVPYA